MAWARGTTPTIEYILPENVSASAIKRLNVAFSQNGNLILQKSISDCVIDGNIITVKLSQKDTLRFKKGDVSMQIRIVTNDDEAFASDEMVTSVSEILRDGEI